MSVCRVCGWFCLTLASLVLLASALWADSIIAHYAHSAQVSIDEHGVPVELHLNRTLGSGVDELWRLRAGAGIVMIMALAALLLPQRKAAVSDADCTPPPAARHRPLFSQVDHQHRNWLRRRQNESGRGHP